MFRLCFPKAQIKKVEGVIEKSNTEENSHLRVLEHFLDTQLEEAKKRHRETDKDRSSFFTSSIAQGSP